MFGWQVTFSSFWTGLLHLSDESKARIEMAHFIKLDHLQKREEDLGEKVTEDTHLGDPDDLHMCQTQSNPILNISQSS